MTLESIFSWRLLIELGMGILLLAVIYLPKVTKVKPPTFDKPTKKEEEELIREWKPKPLGEPVESPEDASPEIDFVNSDSITEVNVNGKPVINFASHDYYSFGVSNITRDACSDIISKYGVGSCGPRGFFGTTQEHLTLEEKFRDWLEVDGAAAYSFGYATVGSVIPAFAKRGDVLILDENASSPVVMGAKLSRSNVTRFKHNDMEDLERILVEYHEQYAKTLQVERKLIMHNPPSKTLPRRFIVVDGICPSTGRIAPLPEIVKLADQYKFRVIVEESYSLGVLGKNGRGITEHYDMKMSDICLMTASLEYAFNTVSGICVGEYSSIAHQETNALGYTFSASAPPYLCTAGYVNLEQIIDDTSKIEKLMSNAKNLRDKIQKIDGVELVNPDQTVTPVVPFKVKSIENNYEDDESKRKAYEKLRDDIISQGYFVSYPVHSYVDNYEIPTPQLVVCANLKHTEAQIDGLREAIRAAL